MTEDAERAIAWACAMAFTLVAWVGIIHALRRWSRS